MANSIIEPGEKVHIMTRRQFPDEVRRHFAGVVLAVSDTMIRAEGYVFVYNLSTNKYQKKTPKRTRLFAIADVGNIINVIPSTVDIEQLHYTTINDRLVVTDPSDFELDINEFGGKD